MIRVALASLVPLALACTPEPASTVEMRQAVVEMVDQGRAMAIEDAMAGLFGAVDTAASLSEVVDAAQASVAAALACATVERTGEATLSLDLGAPDQPCVLDGIGYVGALRVEYARPEGTALLATLFYEPLSGGDAVLEGFSQLTWADDGSRRLVTEIRLDAVTERQIEIQSDRILSVRDGLSQVDGWRRWQTLMGRWEMEIAGLRFAAAEFVPTSGLASIETPFSHTIVLDFARPSAAMRVRANGGRRDRLFEITAEGEVLDLGDT